MTLGNVGHHISVFHIDGTDANKVPHIVNSCLAYIHGQLSSRDKLHIREKVCSNFSLEQVKAAREILFTTLDPNARYTYRGPSAKSASEREKIFDAYEGIYNKMVKLDSDNSTPVFSVPSTELIDLMSLHDSSQSRHISCEDKFKKMEDRFMELHATFNNFTKIITSTNPLPSVKGKSISKSIPPATRDRLMSNASKRSASDVSDEEIVPDDVASGDDDAFILPRRQYRKKARMNSNNSTNQQKSKSENPVPSYSQMTQKMAKLPATKGTVKTAATFRAAVPDIFLFNCHVKCTSKDIAEYFGPFDIKIRKIERKSHELSARSSFKISPETKDDYDKILSAEFLPEEVCARKYIFRRGRINTERKDQFQKKGPSAVASELSTLLKEMEGSGSGLQVTGEAMDSTESQEQLHTENGGDD